MAALGRRSFHYIAGALTILVSFDEAILDGGINGLGWSTRMGAELLRVWDKYFVDGLVNIIGFGVQIASYPTRVIQTGRVQSYALLMVAGLAILVAYCLLHFWL